jgi:hypothetical protein
MTSYLKSLFGYENENISENKKNVEKFKNEEDQSKNSEVGHILSINNNVVKNRKLINNFGHLKGKDDLDLKLAFGHSVKPIDFENKNKNNLVKGEEILLKKLKSKKIFREPTDFDFLQTAIV